MAGGEPDNEVENGNEPNWKKKETPKRTSYSTTLGNGVQATVAFASYKYSLK